MLLISIAATETLAIPLEARLRPNIGNTLSRVSTLFTLSTITPPEVNRFGWNLGHSEYSVCRWPWQILGGIQQVVSWSIQLFGHNTPTLQTDRETRQDRLDNGPVAYRYL